MNKLVVPGRPVPKSYGMSEGRMYPKPKVQKQENLIATLWMDQFGRFQWMDDDIKLAFSVRAYVGDERYGDLKNYFYLAEDALSEVAYNDDKQIIAYSPEPYIVFNAEEERTEIFVRELESGGLIREVKDGTCNQEE